MLEETVLSTDSKSSQILESNVVTPPHITSATNSSLIDSPGFSDNSTIDQISSADSNISTSDTEDYLFEQQLCHIDWDVGEKFEWGFGDKINSKGISTSKGLIMKPRVQKKNLLLRNKKRKYESSKSQGKLSAEEMLICVVNILRTKNSPPAEIEARRNINKNPLRVAQGFIQDLLGVTTITPDSLLRFIVPTGILESKSLSSLADRAIVKATSSEQPKSWAAFVATEPSPSLRFPEKHDGIMKINSAARQFSSSLAKLLPQDVINHDRMCYFVTLNCDAAILSERTRQLASPFTWTSKGLTSFGYPSELEFNGLIRCSFNKSGIIIVASLSFDSCSLVRKCHNLSNHGKLSAQVQQNEKAIKHHVKVPGVTLSSIIEALPPAR